MCRLHAGFIVAALFLSQCSALAATPGRARPPSASLNDWSGLARPDYPTLTIVVRDGVTGEEMPARVSVLDAELEPAHPLPAASCFYHEPYGSAPGYFYSAGRSAMFVPQGPTTVTITRGFEYQTIVDTISVRRDTTVTYYMNRWVDMNALGLYDGDCHTHTNHSGSVYVVGPSDAHMMAQAEDLNVINCLDIAYNFTGGPDSCSTPECIVYMSEEYRSCVYGHAGLLGLSELVMPPSSSWWPLLMDVADSVHAQGAVMTAAHPVSTDDFFDIESVSGKMLARELPIDVTKYKIDAFELLSGYSASHSRTLELWYRVLNCGFRLPACAGTDSRLGAAQGKPPGSFRVYVRVPGGFDYWSWLASLVAGRTFVTNGPLFTEFEVRNFALGDSVALQTEDLTYLDGRVRVECETPLRRVDILCNGEIDQTFWAGPGQCVIDTSFIVTVDRSSWIAARASGPKEYAHTVGDSLFAHTGPVYFSLNGVRIAEPESAEVLYDWVSDFERLARQSGEWTAPDQSLRIFEEIGRAKAVYSALAAGAVTGIAGSSSAAGSADRASLEIARPNPFTSEAAFDFSVPREGHAALRIYSTSGRVVRTLLDRSVSAGRRSASWDGRADDGRQCGAGVYFCRLEAAGDVLTRKLLLLH